MVNELIILYTDTVIWAKGFPKEIFFLFLWRQVQSSFVRVDNLFQIKLQSNSLHNAALVPVFYSLCNNSNNQGLDIFQVKSQKQSDGVSSSVISRTHLWF